MLSDRYEEFFDGHDLPAYGSDPPKSHVPWTIAGISTISKNRNTRENRKHENKHELILMEGLERSCPTLQHTMNHPQMVFGPKVGGYPHG